MADLKLSMRWEKYAPELDDNHKLDRPFYFEVATSLTRAQLRDIDAAVSKVFELAAASVTPPPAGLTPEEISGYRQKIEEAALEAELVGIAAVLEPWVKMGPEALTIAGQPIRTLEQYMRAVSVVASRASASICASGRRSRPSGVWS